VSELCKHFGLGHLKRLRQKAIQGKISKEEIVELLLSYVIKGKDVKPYSKEIYKKCKGNFRELFRVIETEKINGIGTETKFFFKLIKEFIDTSNQEKFLKKTYSVSMQDDVINYFKNSVYGRDKESVYVLFLDAKNKIISSKKIFDGTLTQSLLYPREIIKEAIKESALSIILVHNHPSGNPTPSDNDRKITKKLVFSLSEMDINILDHIIIGTDDDKGYFSFQEYGLIDKYKQEYIKVAEQAGKE